jgi:hypothetical protein
MEVVEKLEQFDSIRDLAMVGETKRYFKQGVMETERRFDVVHAGLEECYRRMNQIASAHPSILRAKGGFEAKADWCGTFEERFEIL